MAQNPCRCIDCGGDQPTHSSDCTYMQETFGDPPMTNNQSEDIAAIAGLTVAQREAIFKAAQFLDLCAGEGIGQRSGVDGATLWADDICMDLHDAFGVEPDKQSLDEALRAHLNKTDGEKG